MFSTTRVFNHFWSKVFWGATEGVGFFCFELGMLFSDGCIGMGARKGCNHSFSLDEEDVE